MNTYEIIKVLAKQKKISIRQLEMRFGYSNGYLAKWANNTPNSDELIKLADYFNVSVDYLLGREEAKPKQVDINDDTVIMTFSGKELSEEDRALVLATTRAILEQRNKNK